LTLQGSACSVAHQGRQGVPLRHRCSLRRSTRGSGGGELGGSGGGGGEGNGEGGGGEGGGDGGDGGGEGGGCGLPCHLTLRLCFAFHAIFLSLCRRASRLRSVCRMAMLRLRTASGSPSRKAKVGNAPSGRSSCAASPLATPAGEAPPSTPCSDDRAWIGAQTRGAKRVAAVHGRRALPLAQSGMVRGRARRRCQRDSRVFSRRRVLVVRDARRPSLGKLDRNGRNDHTTLAPRLIAPPPLISRPFRSIAYAQRVANVLPW
jgi:hypothetical protein